MNHAENRNVEYDAEVNAFIARIVSHKYRIFTNLNKPNKRFFHNDLVARLILMYEDKLRVSLTPKNLENLNSRYKETTSDFRTRIVDFIARLSTLIGNNIVNKQNVLTLASVLIEADNQGVTLKSPTLFEDMLKAEKKLISTNLLYAKYAQQGGNSSNIIKLKASLLLGLLN